MVREFSPGSLTEIILETSTSGLPPAGGKWSPLRRKRQAKHVGPCGSETPDAGSIPATSTNFIFID